MLATLLLLALVQLPNAEPPTKPAPAAACVAIAFPSVQGVDGSATDVGRALRDLFSSYLTGPSIETISLEARLPSQAVDEARQKGCAHVLLPTLTRTRSGGGLLGKVVGQAAGTAAWHVPVGTTAAGSAIRGAAAGGTQAIATTASMTRARDELRLDVRFASPDEVERAAPRTDKARAAVDGEDLLTPLVERAAQAIVTAIARR
jgi:hypothetical protein